MDKAHMFLETAECIKASIRMTRKTVMASSFGLLKVKYQKFLTASGKIINNMETDMFSI
jgi:hypothetical protein